MKRLSIVLKQNQCLHSKASNSVSNLTQSHHSNVIPRQLSPSTKLHAAEIHQTTCYCTTVISTLILNSQRFSTDSNTFSSTLVVLRLLKRRYSIKLSGKQRRGSQVTLQPINHRTNRCYATKVFNTTQL